MKKILVSLAVLSILIVGFGIGFVVGQLNPWFPDIYEGVETGDLVLVRYYYNDNLGGEVEEVIFSSLRMEELLLKQSLHPSINGGLDFLKKISVAKLKTPQNYNMIDFRICSYYHTLPTPDGIINESWSDFDRTLGWMHVTPLDIDSPNELEWGDELLLYVKTADDLGDFHSTPKLISNFLN